MSNNEKGMPIGVDLVNCEPDYTKTVEENIKIFREEYKKVYGVYPDYPLAEKG